MRLVETLDLREHEVCPSTARLGSERQNAANVIASECESSSREVVGLEYDEADGALRAAVQLFETSRRPDESQHQEGSKVHRLREQNRTAQLHDHRRTCAAEQEEFAGC
jgi:hypothetical protein